MKKILYRLHQEKSGQKPDMIITINNVIKRISIKKGTGNSVHQEKVDVFVEFL